MKPQLKYLRYVLRHKWFVFWEALKLGVPLSRALLHDLDKLFPDVFPIYVSTWGKGTGRNCYAHTDELAWATVTHYRRSDHHWQSWILAWDQGDVQVLPMSNIARSEMLADWRAVELARSGHADCRPWYNRNRENIILHPDTRDWIEERL